MTAVPDPLVPDCVACGRRRCLCRGLVRARRAAFALRSAGVAATAAAAA